MFKITLYILLCNMLFSLPFLLPERLGKGSEKFGPQFPLALVCGCRGDTLLQEWLVLEGNMLNRIVTLS